MKITKIYIVDRVKEEKKRRREIFAKTYNNKSIHRKYYWPSKIESRGTIIRSWTDSTIRTVLKDFIAIATCLSGKVLRSANRTIPRKSPLIFARALLIHLVGASKDIPQIEEETSRVEWRTSGIRSKLEELNLTSIQSVETTSPLEPWPPSLLFSSLLLIVRSVSRFQIFMCTEIRKRPKEKKQRKKDDNQQDFELEELDLASYQSVYCSLSRSSLPTASHADHSTPCNGPCSVLTTTKWIDLSLSISLSISLCPSARFNDRIRNLYWKEEEPPPSFFIRRLRTWLSRWKNIVSLATLQRKERLSTSS